MPLPDPYADETTTEIDPDTWRLYLQAKSNAEGWEKEATKLRAKVEEQIGDAHAGTIDGVKVVYYRPRDSWAEARIVKENPDLAQHFYVPVYENRFSLVDFRAAHPEIADKYRSRAFKAVN